MGVPVYCVLCVCTGNICRSPAAELLLSAALDASVQVTSAGTSGLPGAPVSPPMAALLARDGIASDGFASRALTAADVRSADLVLTLTAAHRALVLDLEPLALRRTFALGELAQLASAVTPAEVSGDDDAARLARVAQAAVKRRHHFAGARPQDDVVDPYRRGDAAYAQSYAQLKEHVQRIVGALRASGTS
ncbi:low molecular weight phosphatase family protein [Xylanimonas allomyrinae]|uniref:Low molecular weight phosphatase family protein n=1 Tax=Xylanimonas allomyrinae TaxID=2509459 RepID=A0A4P6EQD3_9MICO|nr:low molecular weight phosphatase family protein [Xylanimonas allomyrinae]QAY63619.1 low molecular weight phosphatase family protein [Xylanimonas allomyrinae]